VCCVVCVCVLLELHSDLDNMQDVESPYMFVLISSVLTWARTKPVDPVGNFTLHWLKCYIVWRDFVLA